MANVATMLLSRVMNSGIDAASVLQQVTAGGVTDDYMPTPAEKQMLLTLTVYVQNTSTKGSVLGPNMLKNKFPNFELVDDPSMTLEGLIDEVKKDHHCRVLEATATEAAALAHTDPMKAASLMQSRAQQILALSTSKSTDILLSEAILDLITEYEGAESGELKSKITWPWWILNEVTGGIQLDDYIVFYGRPKSMKTFVLCCMAAHSYDTGCRVLIYTKEMNAKSIYKRICCFCKKLPYQEFRSGKLLPEAKESFYDAARIIKQREVETAGRWQMITLSASDVPPGGDTPSWLRAKVELYKPDIVFVDGFYLMSDEGSRKQADWQRVMNISRQLRRIPLDLGIPVVATTQANRKAAGHGEANSDELGYSDAIAQDATFFARTVAEVHSPTIALAIGGSREFRLNGIRVGGVPCTDFEFKEKLSENDVEKVKEAEATADASEGKTEKGIKRKPKPAADPTDKAMQEQLANVR